MKKKSIYSLETKWKRYGNYVRIMDMSWPLPLNRDEWEAMPEEKLLMHLKSIHCAMIQMIFDPIKKRQTIIRCMREATTDRDNPRATLNKGE